MDFVNIIDIALKVGLLALAIKCFLMVKFLHPETTDRAGERYTDEDLKRGAKTPQSKAHCKERRNWFFVGGLCSLAAFSYVAWG